MGARVLERWDDADFYERYVGRWSRMVARDFLAWLAVSGGAAWADVGCGTGGLAAGILSRCAPRAIHGIDRAEGFLSAARRTIRDHRVRFAVGDATALPLVAASLDVTVSGLVLNFVGDPEAMVREMIRVTKPGGKVASYVWDYAGGMEIMRRFWDAAIAVRPQDADQDQGNRSAICQPEPLEALFRSVGLTAVSTQAIDVTAVFQDFEDYWTPFLGKVGAAPKYLASVDGVTKARIRRLLEAQLVPERDGTIVLTARAWAVQGMV